MHAAILLQSVGSRVITTETCKQLRVLHGAGRKRLKLTLTLHSPDRPSFRPHAHERSSQEDCRRALRGKGESAVLAQLVSPVPVPGLQFWYSQSAPCRFYRIIQQVANEKPRSAICSELALCHYCCQQLIHCCCAYAR